jgi:hypothetical protein
MDEVIRGRANFRNRSLTFQSKAQLRGLSVRAVVAQGRRSNENRQYEGKRVETWQGCPALSNEDDACPDQSRHRNYITKVPLW